MRVFSLTVGLFGFRESIAAAFVTQSLAIETITLLALLAWTAMMAASMPVSARPDPSRAHRDRHAQAPPRSNPPRITSANPCKGSSC